MIISESTSQTNSLLSDIEKADPYDLFSWEVSVVSRSRQNSLVSFTLVRSVDEDNKMIF